MSMGWRSCLYSAVVGLFLLVDVSDAASSCTSTSFTITSQADADALNTCSTITGNIIISSPELTQINFSGISTIDGNFSASSCNFLQNISAPNLSQISKNFTLSNLPHLTTLQFPLLDNINGGIYWDALPNLTSVSFGSVTALTNELPGANVDGDIAISNTGLSSLAFLNFTHYSEPDMIWIRGNNELDIVNLTGLSWGSNSLQISNNGPATQILLPNLRSVGDMSISDAGNISLDTLSDTSGTITLSNNSFDVFLAPMFTDIEGGLIIQNNNLLDHISLPILSSVKGDITITNNSDLHMIADMDKLFYVQGIMTLSGDFTSVTLPTLRTVNGGLHINSTYPSFDCTTFDNLASSESWSSPSFYSCGAYAPGSSHDSATHSTSSSPSSSTHLSKDVKVLVIILSIIAGLFLIALCLRIYVRKTNPARRGSLGGLVRRRDSGSGVGGSQRDVSLEEVGVSRAAEEGDPLPKYTRIGDPGEVPPGYAVAVAASQEGGNGNENGSANVNAATAGNAPVTAPPARARRRWFFW